MKELFEKIKDKKILVFALAAIAVLIVALFIISAAINNKKEPIIPIAPAAPKEKTMDEIINDLTAPVKNGETPAPVSKEVIDSLTAPAAAIKPASGAKDNKAAGSAPTPIPTPTPISEDIINSLTAPVK